VSFKATEVSLLILSFHHLCAIALLSRSIDRFCAAEQVDGKWNVFTGDQIGSLLGYAALVRYKTSGLPIGEPSLLYSVRLLELEHSRDGITDAYSTKSPDRQAGDVRFDCIFEDVALDGTEGGFRLPRNFNGIQVSHFCFLAQTFVAFRLDPRGLQAEYNETRLNLTKPNKNRTKSFPALTLSR
jgi:hypothetical protein